MRHSKIRDSCPRDMLRCTEVSQSIATGRGASCRSSHVRNGPVSDGRPEKGGLSLRAIDGSERLTRSHRRRHLAVYLE